MLSRHRNSITISIDGDHDVRKVVATAAATAAAVVLVTAVVIAEIIVIIASVCPRGRERGNGTKGGVRVRGLL